MAQSTQDMPSLLDNDTRRINLKRLKHEIDRNMLKIQMLAERIPLSHITQPPYATHRTARIQTAIQTEGITEPEVKRDQSQKENRQPQFERSSKGPRPKINFGERKPLSMKENDFLICKNDTPYKQERQMQQQVKSFSTIEVESIPHIQLEPSFQRPTQSESIPSMSPIYKDQFKKTDRSLKKKMKTSRTFSSKVTLNFHCFTVSQECITKVQATVDTLKNKMRKEPNDHNLRLNILKKVEQKFKAELKAQF